MCVLFIGAVLYDLGAFFTVKPGDDMLLAYPVKSTFVAVATNIVSYVFPPLWKLYRWNFGLGRGSVIIAVAAAAAGPVSWDDEGEWEELVPERIVGWEAFSAGETQ